MNGEEHWTGPIRIAAPIRTVYCVEQTDRTRRLSYFIPIGVLREMVRSEQVKQSILEDFPDGAEIEVNDIEFKGFERDYRYVHRLSPGVLQNGLRAIISRIKRAERFRGYFYIQPSVLEKSAMIVQQIEQSFGHPRPVDKSSKEFDDLDRRREIRQVTRFQRFMKSAVEKAELPQVNPDLPLEKQQCCHVEMSKGIKPLELFIIAQNGWKGANNGNLR